VAYQDCTVVVGVVAACFDCAVAMACGNCGGLCIVLEDNILDNSRQNLVVSVQIILHSNNLTISRLAIL